MDYPEIDTGLIVRHRFGGGLMIRLRQGVSKYSRNALRGSAAWMPDTGVELRWKPPGLDKITMELGLHNLFDDDFQVYAGQRRAGRSFCGAVTYAW